MVVADPGITVLLSTINASVVKIWLAGGIDQHDYLVSAVMTTTGGRVHYGTISIKVLSVW
jgi:hypothetical protein